MGPGPKTRLFPLETPPGILFPAMKHLLQDLRTGRVALAEVPRPSVRPGHLLIASTRTLVSPGTERMLLEFGRAGWLEKARRQPDKVRQALQKIRTDGVAATVEAVMAKLERPLPLGYCNCGKVLEIGDGVLGFAPGDRVVSNGPHAEIVCVPRNLCAKVPDGVSDEEAAFTVLSAVALEGIRLASPSLGETFGVMGLGLVGLLAVRLLNAAGCRVVGIDIAGEREELAKACGAVAFVDSSRHDPVAAAMAATDGRGVDGVIIAAATKSREPISQAARMSRKRGRIVLVGVAGLEISRAEFYEKELSFQVSCSYGPGRYDPEYEEKGRDYPFGFVRWTAGRNFEAVLELMRAGSLDVRPLVGGVVPFESAPAAYEQVLRAGTGKGILFAYPDAGPKGGAAKSRAREGKNGEGAAAIAAVPLRAGKDRASVAVIGAGDFALRVLIPAVKETGARLAAVASETGVSAAHAAKKFGFRAATADYRSILSDPAIDTVFVATRHDSHARIAAEALSAGKHVFVEKPLALDPAQLEAVARAYAQARARKPLHLMVGFNRRFAPHVRMMKQLLEGAAQPRVMIVTVNAGAVPPGHWVHDPLVGGGRIVGEGCHFVDLLRYLAGEPVAAVHAAFAGGVRGAQMRRDTATFTLSFADGSLGTVHYLANGHKGFPKERVEVFCGGRILVLDNFRRLVGYGWKDFRGHRLWRQDKGHAAEMAAFLSAVEKGGAPPIPFDEILEVTRTTFAVERAAAG